MSRPLSDSDPKKWDYSFHCFVKHELFQKYFTAWSKVLGTSHKHIGYVDGFAGRGNYTDGSIGSPILALQTLTNNAHYFHTCKCILIEKDPDNYSNLRKLIAEKEKDFSSKIEIILHNDTFKGTISEYFDLLDTLPFFVFVDPFGFKGFPLTIIQEILIRKKNELFINLMTRNIKRFITSDSHKKALTSVFGKDLETVRNFTSQEEIVDYYINNLQKYCKYAITYQVGHDKKNENIYYLIHTSDHFKGFEIMKGVMYNHMKEGQFGFRGIQDLKTTDLLPFVDPDNEISYMKRFLYNKYKGKRISFQNILEETYNKTNYIKKHYKRACHQLTKENKAIVLKRVTTKKDTSMPDGEDIIQFLENPGLDRFLKKKK